MRFIHCADIHLDSKMETNLTKEQAKERKNEILQTFAKMIAYAEQREVTAILIAGDLFDTPAVEQKKIKSRVLELISNHQNMDFLYLKGNHDRSGFLTDEMQKPDNLKVFGNTWSGIRYGQVVITGMELNKNTMLTVYDELQLQQEDVNIVMLHGQESMYDNYEDSEIIPIPRLQNKYIDYLALGHIHSVKIEKLDQRGRYAYSGCLEGRGFDECGPKGFIELEVNDNEVKQMFHPFAMRTLHEVTVNLTGICSETDILNRIKQATDEISNNDLVKIILDGEVTTETEIDIEYLQPLLRERFYFLKIYDRTKLLIQYEDYKNEISLKGEFVRGVLASDLSEEDKKHVILSGIKALMGRELG